MPMFALYVLVMYKTFSTQAIFFCSLKTVLCDVNNILVMLMFVLCVFLCLGKAEL